MFGYLAVGLTKHHHVFSIIIKLVRKPSRDNYVTSVNVILYCTQKHENKCMTYLHSSSARYMDMYRISQPSLTRRRRFNVLSNESGLTFTLTPYSSSSSSRWKSWLDRNGMVYRDCVTIVHGRHGRTSKGLGSISFVDTISISEEFVLIRVCLHNKYFPIIDLGHKCLCGNNKFRPSGKPELQCLLETYTPHITISQAVETGQCSKEVRVRNIPLLNAAKRQCLN